MKRSGSGPVRRTVDLGAYPDLVVVYLGMRVQTPRGIFKLMKIGPQIRRSWRDEPDGLLLHEDIIWSLMPPHVGMRQYWRDFSSLERWTRSEPHQRWWREFLAGPVGTGFWHEAHLVRGGTEGVYINMKKHVGMARFAPVIDATGRMSSARDRAAATGGPT